VKEWLSSACIIVALSSTDRVAHFCTKLGILWVVYFMIDLD